MSGLIEWEMSSDSPPPKGNCNRFYEKNKQTRTLNVDSTTDSRAHNTTQE